MDWNSADWNIAPAEVQGVCKIAVGVDLWRHAAGGVIQWRLSSMSGQETIDIFQGGVSMRKVHVK
jgi:hypothetical protein